MEPTNYITADAAIIVRDILTRTKFAKTEVCKTTPMTDAPAMMMIVVTVDESNDEYEAAARHCESLGLTQVLNVGFAPLVDKDDVADSFLEACKGLQGLVKPEYLFIVAEGYMKVLSDLTEVEAEKFQRGQLAKDFSENPFTDVREGIIVSGVDGNLNSAFVTSCTYTYDDFGVPQYDDEQSQVMELTREMLESGEAGRMVQVLAIGAGTLSLAWEMRDFIGHMMTKPEDE